MKTPEQLRQWCEWHGKIREKKDYFLDLERLIVKEMESGASRMECGAYAEDAFERGYISMRDYAELLSKIRELGVGREEEKPTGPQLQKFGMTAKEAVESASGFHATLRKIFSRVF